MMHYKYIAYCVFKEQSLPKPCSSQSVVFLALYSQLIKNNSFIDRQSLTLLNSLKVLFVSWVFITWLIYSKQENLNCYLFSCTRR